MTEAESSDGPYAPRPEVAAALADYYRALDEPPYSQSAPDIAIRIPSINEYEGDTAVTNDTDRPTEGATVMIEETARQSDTRPMARAKAWLDSPRTLPRLTQAIAMVIVVLLVTFVVATILVKASSGSAANASAKPAAAAAADGPPSTQLIAYVDAIVDKVPGHPDEVRLVTSCGDFYASTKLVQSSDVYESRPAMLQVTNGRKVTALSDAGGLNGYTYSCPGYDSFYYGGGKGGSYDGTYGAGQPLG